MRSESELEGVTLLGNNKTQYKTTYSPEVLEKFPNKHPGNDYMVTFNCPEFTSLCPKTGQPDFAERFTPSSFSTGITCSSMGMPSTLYTWMLPRSSLFSLSWITA